MKRWGSALAVALLCAAAAVSAQAAAPAARHGAPPVDENTKRALQSIETHRQEIVDLSHQVWGFAETALKETRSSAVLADYAEKQGFRVTRGVASLPTAFTAEYGEGPPVIGIVGEYDALPGISQESIPEQKALVPGAPGHGCGHNLFGAGSLGAAVAIKELIAAGRLKGTIRFYGTPAEEAVGGKVYMLREGLFRDLDVCLAWHPGDKSEVDTKSTQAMVDLRVEFHGKAAHAAFDPWNGRSALDGLEIFTHALNMMREHMPLSARIHYVIVDGGKVPNVVPDYAMAWVWLRDTKRTGVEDLLARVRKMVQGSGMAADVGSTLTVQGGSYEMLVSRAGAHLLHDNFAALPPLAFTPEEQSFARTIQKATGVEPKGMRVDLPPLPEVFGEPEGGSTDVGDVSWVVPTLHVTIATAPEGAPWHAWPVVATAGMSIGQKGMIYAAQGLASTMVDLFESPDARQKIRTEFEQQTKGVTYKGYVPDGPPPAAPSEHS